MLHARVIAQFKRPQCFYKNTLLFEHFLFMTDHFSSSQYVSEGEKLKRATEM